jgi:hypothetical protein
MNNRASLMQDEQQPPSPHSPMETSPLVRTALPAGARTSGQSQGGDRRSSRDSSDQFHSGSSSENGAQVPSSINSHQPPRPMYSSRDSSSSALSPRRRQSGTFDDLTPEILGLSGAGTLGANYSRYSSIPSARGSTVGLSGFADPSDDVETGYILPSRGSYLYQHGGDMTPGSRGSVASFTQGDMVKAATTDALLWDEKNEETDDYLHNPDPEEYKGRKVPPGMFPVLNPARRTKSEFQLYSLRGFANVFGLVVVLGGLVAIFAFWPIAVCACLIAGLALF